MARFFSSVIGKVIGKLGSTTFFDRGGKSFVKPNKHEHRKSESNSVLAANNRKRFAQSHYFAKSLKRHKDIVAFWNAMTVNGDSTYFKLHGWNRTKCTVDSLTEKNGITPEGIPISVESLSLNKNTLSFKFKLLRTYKDYLLPPYQLYIVVYLNLGAMSKESHSDSSHLKIIDINIDSEDYTEVTLDFMDSLADSDIPDLNKLYFFIAAIKRVPGRVGFEWSSSFVKFFFITQLTKDWYNSTNIK